VLQSTVGVGVGEGGVGVGVEEHVVGAGLVDTVEQSILVAPIPLSKFVYTEQASFIFVVKTLFASTVYDSEYG